MNSCCFVILYEQPSLPCKWGEDSKEIASEPHSSNLWGGRRNQADRPDWVPGNCAAPPGGKVIRAGKSQKAFQKERNARGQQVWSYKADASLGPPEATLAPLRDPGHLAKPEIHFLILFDLKNPAFSEILNFMWLSKFPFYLRWSATPEILHQKDFGKERAREYILNWWQTSLRTV